MLAPAVVDAIYPLERQDGLACRWPYLERENRTNKGKWAAWLLEWDMGDECAKRGFPDYSIHNIEGLERELRLLGPDSPAEYIYRFDRRLIGDDAIEALHRDIIWFIKRMEIVRRIQEAANG